jgi:hypothetical protein
MEQVYSLHRWMRTYLEKGFLKSYQSFAIKCPVILISTEYNFIINPLANNFDSSKIPDTPVFLSTSILTTNFEKFQTATSPEKELVNRRAQSNS